jgi:hypothetical protein
MPLKKIVRIGRKLLRLTAWDKIPRVPRVLATDFKTFTDAEARVMARLGIRSPSGLQLALKRHKVNNVDELVALLEHHKPRRRLLYRLRLMAARAGGSRFGHPHRKEIYAAVKVKPADVLIEQRLKRLTRD